MNRWEALQSLISKDNRCTSPAERFCYISVELTAFPSVFVVVSSLVPMSTGSWAALQPLVSLGPSWSQVGQGWNGVFQTNSIIDATRGGGLTPQKRGILKPQILYTRWYQTFYAIYPLAKISHLYWNFAKYNETREYVDIYFSVSFFRVT